MTMVNPDCIPFTQVYSLRIGLLLALSLLSNFISRTRSLTRTRWHDEAYF